MGIGTYASTLFSVQESASGSLFLSGVDNCGLFAANRLPDAEFRGRILSSLHIPFRELVRILLSNFGSVFLEEFRA